MVLRSIFALAFVGLATRQALAEVSSTEYIHFYPVNGVTLTEASAVIHADSPIIVKNKKFVGLSQPRYKWSLQTKVSEAGCSVSAAKVDLVTHTTLPRWRHVRTAQAADTREWYRFIYALSVHERNHKRLYEQGAHRLYRRFLNMTPARNCRQIRRNANRLFQNEIDRIRSENEAYDARTRHGIDEGTGIRLPRPLTISYDLAPNSPG